MVALGGRRGLMADGPGNQGGVAQGEAQEGPCSVAIPSPA